MSVELQQGHTPLNQSIRIAYSQKNKLILLFFLINTLNCYYNLEIDDEDAGRAWFTWTFYRLELF
jgi:hypothetical protein